MTSGGSRAEAWDDARRVLCVRLDYIGDVLMTTPALRAVRSGGRHVTLLTSPQGAEAGWLVPEVDDVIVYDAPWLKATAPRSNPDGDARMIERLRDRRFDAAVVFTVYSQSPLPAALMCYLAGIPRRLAHSRENPYQLLTDWVPEVEPDEVVRHEVRRQLDLVATVGMTTRDERLSVRVGDRARATARRILEETAVRPDAPWLAVHPGATAPSRRYPPELFAAAAATLAREDGCRIVFTGSDRDAAVIEEIASRMGAASASLAGRLTLEELAAVLERAPALVAGNTGPVHLAAAVGTPVVDLYALTNPQHTPWGVENRVLFHDVPCRFCYKSICPEGHHNCLRLVPPEAVVEAVRELLSEGARSPLHAALHG